MTKRKEQGATLALVISLVFVFLLVGAAFFIWQLLIGGGKELQHATDSGNLNVAKQALLAPDYTIPDAIDPNTGTNLRKEFGDALVDSKGNVTNKVNLLNFNRLIGKAILAQLNAKAEGTQNAVDNATALTKSVYSIGQKLQANLIDANSLKGQFEGISNQNSTRMLHSKDATGQMINQADVEYGVSYMARGRASNVFIDSSQYPFDENGNQVTLGPKDTVSKDVGGQKNYLVGYQGITIKPSLGGFPSTWAIPMRPGEQPHLVTVQDFTALQNAPQECGTNAIPNAFKSGANATFMGTGGNLQLRSCAIIGVLDKDFPIQQSGGTIIIDNSGSNIGTLDVNDPGKNGSIYADPTKMMQPAGMEIFSVTALAGTFPDGTSSHKYMLHADSEADGRSMVDTIVSHHQTTQSNESGSVTSPSPESIAHSFPGNMALTGTDFWAMKMDSQSRYISRFPERNQIMGTLGAPGGPGTTVGGIATKIDHVAFCNNTSFSDGSGNANPPDCGGSQNMKAFLAYLNGDLGTPGGSGSTTYNDLMPLEEYILQVSSGSGAGAGCVFVGKYGPIGGCYSNSTGDWKSGLKHITTNPGPGSWTSGTLSELLGDSNGSPYNFESQIHRDIATRLKQIAPKADAESFISNTIIPYNKLLYVYSKDQGETLTIDTNAPSSLAYNYASQPSGTRPVVTPPLNVPDGKPVMGEKDIRISGSFVNGPIWECGSGQASGRSASVSKWYPSSGKAGLLGVLKFNNCPEASGPDWCCP